MKTRLFITTGLIIGSTFISAQTPAPAGDNLQLQFNENNSFGASPYLRWDGTNLRLEDMGSTSAKLYFRSESGDHSYIFSENYGSNLNRLVINTQDDGDGDYVVFRNKHWSNGDLDVFEIHRSYMQARGSRNWSETIQGHSKGIIHLNPANSTDHYGSAITFGASDRDSGNSAQAGIYTRSDGSYGTKMYFSTTNLYSEGAKTRMMIDYNGNVGIGYTSPSAQLIVGSSFGAAISGSGGGNAVFGTNIAIHQGGSNHNQLYSPYSHSNNYGYAGMHARWGKIYFYTSTENTTAGNLITPSTRMLINNYGDVGIGTNYPDAKLTVAGNIHAQEVKVTIDAGTGPDYVFEKDYDLKSLEETEKFIKSEKHLPEIPSAKEMEADGVRLGEMNMLLLKKIEELTLYTIEQQKLLNEQQQLLSEQRAINQEITERLETLEKQ